MSDYHAGEGSAEAQYSIKFANGIHIPPENISNFKSAAKREMFSSKYDKQLKQNNYAEGYVLWGGDYYLCGADNQTGQIDVFNKIDSQQYEKETGHSTNVGGYEYSGRNQSSEFNKSSRAGAENLYDTNGASSKGYARNVGEFRVGGSASVQNTEGGIGAAAIRNEKSGGDITEQGDYSIKNKKDTPVFVSNAKRAVEGIKQDKATPEQWLNMLQKNGGLKAGEDKWLGLSDWLKEQDKSVTKQDILDYIAKNEIRIEEVKYAKDRRNPEVLKFIEDLDTEIQEMYQGLDESLSSKERDKIVDSMISDRYSGITEYLNSQNGRLHLIDDEAVLDLHNYLGYSLPEKTNDTRYRYTTKGLDNYREIALTVPKIKSYNTSDKIHFGDAGEGRAVAWIRFGETTDVDGNKVLVLDEIQSKRHQDGREKGYYTKENEEKQKQLVREYNQLWDEINRLQKEIEVKRAQVLQIPDELFALPAPEKWEAITKFRESQGSGMLSKMEGDLRKLYKEVEQKEQAMNQNIREVPDAPFDKNWHELAMKRMLRLAAEEGFDKIAWTTGDQQATRYKINGDGMKGFYDKMLPSFMNKYGKKWGVKVGTVEMPGLEENNVMHSVDVTPEMRDGVMEGQVQFSIKGDTNKLESKIASQQNEISRLKDRIKELNYDARWRDIENKYELAEYKDAVRESASQVLNFINNNASAELQRSMGKREFTSLLRSLEDAATTTDVETALRQVDYTLTDANLRKQSNDLKSLITTKVRGQNAQGVAKARAVDNATRVVFEYAKSLYKGMRDSGLGPDIKAERKRRKEALDTLNDMATELKDNKFSAFVVDLKKIS